MRSPPRKKNPRHKVIKSASPGICLFESVFRGRFFYGKWETDAAQALGGVRQGTGCVIGDLSGRASAAGSSAGPGHSGGGGSLRCYSGTVCDLLCSGRLFGSGAGGNGTPPGSHAGRGSLRLRVDRGGCSGLAGDYLDGAWRHSDIMCPGRRPSGRPAGRTKAGWEAAAPLTGNYGEISQKGFRRGAALPRNAAGGGPSQNPQMWGF